MSNEQEQPPTPEDYTLDFDDAIEEALAPKDETSGEAFLRRFMAKCRKRDERIKAALQAGEKVRPEDEKESQREHDENAQAIAELRERKRGEELLKEWNEKKELAAWAKLGLPPLEDVEADKAKNVAKLLTAKQALELIDDIAGFYTISKTRFSELMTYPALWPKGLPKTAKIERVGVPKRGAKIYPRKEVEKFAKAWKKHREGQRQ